MRQLVRGRRRGAPAKLPVIFIPGITGSTIVDYADNSTLWPSLFSSSKIHKLSLYPNDHPSSQVLPSAVIQYAFDVEAIYAPLFQAFQSAGYPLYDTGGAVAKQTFAGCDTSQLPNGPLFFPFAYDWRKDNAANGALLGDYIRCVQKLYPGTKVNVLTHSMGGLVARSYILQSGTASNVNALLTVAAPWLGGPKVPYIYQTGDYLDIIPSSALKAVAGSFNGLAELLPSTTYFSVTAALQPSVILQDSYCLATGATTCSGPLTPTAYLSAIDAAYGQQGFTPGATGNRFHTTPFTNPQNSIDDWRGDVSGVRYFHIIGLQAAVATPAQVQYTCEIPFHGSCYWLETSLTYTQGDGTVPWLSALRYTALTTATVGLPDYNAPNATILPFVSPSTSDDGKYEHTGLVSNNPQVLSCIIEIFAAGAPGASCPPALLRPSSGTPSLAAPPKGDAHYLTIRNAASVVVQDDAGNVTGPHRGSVASIPAVLTYQDVHTDFAALPAAGTYTVTIVAGTLPLFIESRTGSDTATTSVLRYQALSLPAGTAATLRLTPGGAAWLHAPGGLSLPPSYEGSSDDRERPRLAISVDRSGAGQRLRIEATDASGIAAVHYAIDGGPFVPYEEPIALPAGVRRVTAFAEDSVGLRSPIVERLLLWTTFAPVAGLRDQR
ncbi:MAG: hypothetical protein KatS3mg060_1197 [Dehalococcoidia bacterium]|nr:MAG: hypothetical protein KatS3mg060_1197 [Dehalococcoidia bacterium]